MRQSIADFYANFVPPDPPIVVSDDDPYGNELDRPDTILLLPLFHIRDAIRPRRNHERDPIEGEPGFVLRPRLDLNTNQAFDDRNECLDGSSVSVLIPGPSGVTFRRTTLLSGLPAIDVGPTKTPESDGLSGGIDAPADLQAREWEIETPELIITVQARTRKEAKREGKAVLNIPMGEPFPAGTRIRAVG